MRGCPPSSEPRTVCARRWRPIAPTCRRSDTAFRRRRGSVIDSPGQPPQDVTTPAATARPRPQPALPPPPGGCSSSHRFTRACRPDRLPTRRTRHDNAHSVDRGPVGCTGTLRLDGADRDGTGRRRSAARLWRTGDHEHPGPLGCTRGGFQQGQHSGHRDAHHGGPGHGLPRPRRRAVRFRDLEQWRVAQRFVVRRLQRRWHARHRVHGAGRCHRRLRRDGCDVWERQRHVPGLPARGQLALGDQPGGRRLRRRRAERPGGRRHMGRQPHRS